MSKPKAKTATPPPPPTELKNLPADLEDAKIDLSPDARKKLEAQIGCRTAELAALNEEYLKDEKAIQSLNEAFQQRTGARQKKALHLEGMIVQAKLLLGDGKPNAKKPPKKK